MSKLLKIGNAIFLAFGLVWLFFSVNFLYEYLNFNFQNLKDDLAKILPFCLLLLIVAFYFREATMKKFNWLVRYLNQHKWMIFLFMLGFQLVLVFTSIRIASHDGSCVFYMATDSAYAMESDYLSINPNNYLLIIWDKINYLIFHHNTVLALGLWNIFFIDTSILFIFMATKDYLSKKIADTSFFLLVLILGFSPQHIYTYSDPIALFFLSLTIFLFIKALKNNLAPVYLAGAGFIYAIAFGLRPTVLIFGIAGLIVFVHHLIQKNIYHSMKRIVTGALAFCLVFLAMNQAISYSLHHQNFAKYEEGKSRTLFYFVDLGLTFVGNNHAELPADVLSATGEDRNEEAIEDIKSRMAAYSYKDFVGHLFYKYYWITNEGMFGWFQERVLNEASPLDSAWLMNFQQWTISKLVRTYVYVEGENYNYYARAIQMVWILISFGIAFYPFFYREKFYPLWMQITVFGALLFLMIFEGGRTRYLIQFLPAIITVSACGLVAVHDRMTLHKKGDS